MLLFAHMDRFSCGIFQRCYQQFWQYLLGSFFPIMHDWEAVEPTICLAPRYHGHSLLAQNYDFCLPSGLGKNPVHNFVTIS